MKKFALIGKRLDYSLSPLMHNSLFELAGVQAEYGALECGEEELASVCAVLRKEYSGANVTVPYKSAVIPFLDEITGAAKRCGAVNTVINSGGRLIGDSTDGEGFMRSLEGFITPQRQLTESGERAAGAAEALKGKRVLLLGSGGAARAVLSSLLQCGAVTDVLNRTRKKAVDMLEELAHAGADCFCARVADRPMPEYFLTINATPLGGAGHEEETPLAQGYMNSGAFYDCVYSPSVTRFLREAAEKGHMCRNGLGMLFEQGVLSQGLWGYEYTQQQKTEVYDRLVRELARREQRKG